MGTPLVAIVIVSYNSYEDISRCLKSLFLLDYQNYFVVIVDNNSSDGSLGKLQDEINNLKVSIPKVKLISSQENRGFAAGNNLGITYAMSQGAEYIWLLNPDTTVQRCSLQELIEVQRSDPTIGACGSKMFYGALRVEGSDLALPHKIWGAGGAINFAEQEIRMLGFGEFDTEEFCQPRDCDYLPGCSILIPTSTIMRCGLMREEYFHFFEETDWCQRIQSEGFRLRFVPKSIVEHHFESAKMQTAFSVYYYNRNRRLFWFRFLGLRAKIFLYLKVLFVELPQGIRARNAAENSEMQDIFQSHINSCKDFLRFDFWKS